MTFEVHKPSFPLNRFVKYFYCPRGPRPYPDEKVLPGPVADLKINFGGAVRAMRGVDARPVENYAEGWCMGLWDEYHTVTWPDHTDFIGVSFLPGGAYAVLGVDLGELTNQLVPLDAIWGSFAAELRDRLYDAGGTVERFALLERVLTARISRVAEIDRIRPALNALSTSRGLIPVGKLSEATDVSQKHLITLFNRVVGTTPKKLARLYRLQSLLETIDLTRHLSWTSVAQDFLYFDQAHFNKEFKQLTGLTPTDYVTRRKRLAATSPQHAVYSRLLPAG